MHTAKCGDTAFFLFIVSVQVGFTFDFLFSNSVRLIPMSFRQPDSPVFESDACYALHFPPLTFAIILPKSLDIANPGAHCDSLDNCYLADDLEIHLGILASLAMPSLSRVTQLWIDTAREFGDPI